MKPPRGYCTSHIVPSLKVSSLTMRFFIQSQGLRGKHPHSLVCYASALKDMMRLIAASVHSDYSAQNLSSRKFILISDEKMFWRLGFEQSRLLFAVYLELPKIT